MHSELITSAQNPKVKLLLGLQQKSQELRRHGLFVVEGRREIERCIQTGYQVDTLFWCPEIYGDEQPMVDGARLFQVSADILRSADAAHVDAVIVCDPQCDLYNPNIIRASVGAFFSVPTVACTSEACIQWLKSLGIQILTAQLQDSRYYYDTCMSSPTAIVMGTEATGLTDQWRQAADAHIKIPMLGIGDSLNVSVSAAILMFEAVRQRQTSVTQ